MEEGGVDHRSPPIQLSTNNDGENLEFLSNFPGNICYCALDDKRSRAGLVHWHEGANLTREQIHEELREANESGFGVFFCVNEIDRNLDPSRMRTARMIKRIRAIWADMDTYAESPRMDWPIKPSIIVNTSPGKYHYYWLTSTTEFEQWRQVMNGLANNYASDANARDLVRVLRLPGYYHHKHDPFLSSVVHDDGHVYEWDEILDAFPPDITTPVSVASTHGENKSFSNYQDAVNSIITGENFHGAIMWLLNHWVNKGMTDPAELKDLIKNQLARATVQDDRWEARNEDHYLDANVRDAIRFVADNPLVEDIIVDVLDVEEEQVELNWPPGLMGDLCREIYAMAPHPNEEIAILAGFTLVAGIAGRTFNVLGTGLNLYTACLARTGIGKSVIKDSINIALREVGLLNNGPSFMGPSRITGPKALLNVLREQPTKILVLEESGLLSASKAGDSPGITRMLLELYTSSGKSQWYGEEAYSKKEDGSGAIRSPAVTLAHVSTPESYIKAMRSKDSINSGDLARIWTLRSLRTKSYLNMSRRSTFSEPVAKRINQLLGICKVNQSTEMLATPRIIDISTELINIEEENKIWVDLENRTFITDPIKAVIASRAALKILKIASVASVFNDTGGKVGVDEYAWAKNAILKEFSAINVAVSLGSSDDMSAVIENIVIPTITKILNYHYKDVKACPAKVLKGKGIFSRSNLTNRLKNHLTVKAMDSDTQKSTVTRSGVDKVIDYLLKNNMIVKLTFDQKKHLGVWRESSDLYKITSEFKMNVMRDDEKP